MAVYSRCSYLFHSHLSLENQGRRISVSLLDSVKASFPGGCIYVLSGIFMPASNKDDD